MRAACVAWVMVAVAGASATAQDPVRTADVSERGLTPADFTRISNTRANGYPSEWIGALKKGEAMDVDVFVPAHGFVDRPDVLREEERNFRMALERILAEGRRLHDAHVPVQDAAARANFDAIDGWTRAANSATNALARVYMELDGELP